MRGVAGNCLDWDQRWKGEIEGNESWFKGRQLNNEQ